MHDKKINANWADVSTPFSFWFAFFTATKSRAYYARISIKTVSVTTGLRVLLNLCYLLTLVAWMHDTRPKQHTKTIRSVLQSINSNLTVALSSGHALFLYFISNCHFSWINHLWSILCKYLIFWCILHFWFFFLVLLVLFIFIKVINYIITCTIYFNTLL